MEHQTDALPNLIRRLELEAGTSNDTLSDQDSRIVRQLLPETRIKLGDLDREILADPSSSQHLSKQQALLYERIKRFRVALAPHKSIPPELLSYIFLLALDRAITLPLRRHRSSAPWSISYVCSRWRRVALAEPRLWDTIHVDYSLSTNHSRLNTIANDIVSRSGECGISIAYEEATPILEDSTSSGVAVRRDRVDSLHLTTLLATTRFREAFLRDSPSPRSVRLPVSTGVATQPEFIAAHIHRICHLEISTTRDALVQYLESPPLQLVSLESTTLSIRGRYNFDDILTKGPMTLFSDARSLRKITFIANVQYRLFPELLLVPWGQITDLVLRQVLIPHDMTLTMLRQCANLVNCTLTLGDLSDPVLRNPPDNDNPATFLHLRSLTLQIEVTRLAIYLLDSISLPSLRALDIGPNPRGGLTPQALPQDALRLMLKRSGCTLDTFTCKYKNEFDLYQLLQEMPELRNLTLTALYLGTSVVEAMSRGELLPKLELIHCGLKSIHPFLDYLENSWSGEDQLSNNTYEGLTVVNVWGYNLADRAGAEQRMKELMPQFEKRGRTVSISLS